MVNVKFFGVLRLEIKESNAIIEAATINDLIIKLEEKFEKIDINQLRNSIILVNGVNMNNLKRYKTKLKDGDEVLFASPVSGG